MIRLLGLFESISPIITFFWDFVKKGKGSNVKAERLKSNPDRKWAKKGPLT
jgi:hypothetical protein